MKLWQQTTKEFGIDRLFISKAQFQSIIVSCTNLEILRFEEWTIESCNVRFNSQFDHKLRVLDLKSCGWKDFGNWKETPKKFTDILKAISECSLKDSIEDLCLFKSGLDYQFIKESLVEFGLEKLKLDFTERNN